MTVAGILLTLTLNNRHSYTINVDKRTREVFHEKSLKIPKGESESVYLRRTDNTIAKIKSKKRTNNDLQNIHIKLKIE